MGMYGNDDQPQYGLVIYGGGDLPSALLRAMLAPLVAEAYRLHALRHVSDIIEETRGLNDRLINALEAASSTSELTKFCRIRAIYRRASEDVEALLGDAGTTAGRDQSANGAADYGTTPTGRRYRTARPYPGDRRTGTDRLADLLTDPQQPFRDPREIYPRW